MFKTLLFLLRSGAILSARHLHKKYDLVHVHNMPDFLVFAAAVPKLMGSKTILDIHDIVPELYCSKFGISSNSVVFKLIDQEGSNPNEPREK